MNKNIPLTSSEHRYRFQQVADAIRAKVVSGQYTEGERLPSQHRMAREYNVAFNTFKAALDILEVEGYVVRRVGDGTFVAKPETRRPKALAVDDDDGMREFLAGALDRCGWDCTAVESGPRALEELEKSKYDLLLTDLVMPVMTGAELIGEVRRRDNDVQVVVITAYPETGLMTEAMEAGPFAVLKKPTRLNELRLVLSGIGDATAGPRAP